jgi:uncharacterized protein YjbI with pentapeptide repeats
VRRPCLPTISAPPTCGADLDHALLEGANLDTASVAGASLGAADLKGASLVGTNLQGSLLRGAALAGVSSANVIGIPATISSGYAIGHGYLVGPGVSLPDADFANLALPISFDFAGADLAGASFSNTTVENGDFAGADLVGANFANGTYTGSSFVGANLTSATFVNADYDSADLDNAKLKYTNLTTTRTDPQTVNVNLVTWDHTVCPDGTNSDDDGGTCVTITDYLR